jgi:UPF0755 protein
MVAPQYVTEASGGSGDESVAPPRPPMRRRRRLRLGLALLVAVVVGVVVWGVVWYEGAVNEGPAGAAVIVEVPAGSSMSAVTADLVRRGVVGSGLAFRIYLTLHGTPTVAAGRYELRRHQGFGAVRDRLAGGPDVFAVSVIPGTTVAELATTVADDVSRFSSASFLGAVTSGTAHSPWQPPGSDNLDGLLGPGTYIVVPGETDVELLAQMIDRFDTEAAADNLAGAASADGVTPYEAVTAASIVQKEAISPGDSAQATAHNAGPVARVIYNRLARGMPLQMDSTVLYAEGRDGGPVTPADEERPTPYNTYLHTGLTPTPICFPSAVALRAALYPPTGGWLYFQLTSSDGTETFSATYAGQLAAEKLARSRGLP